MTSQNLKIFGNFWKVLDFWGKTTLQNFGNALLEVVECRNIAQTNRSDAAQKIGVGFFSKKCSFFCILKKPTKSRFFYPKNFEDRDLNLFFANQVAVSEIIFHNLETTRFQLSKTLENVEKEFQVMENGRFEVVIWLFVFDEIPLKEQPTVE